MTKEYCERHYVKANAETRKECQQASNCGNCRHCYIPEDAWKTDDYTPYCTGKNSNW